MCFDRLSPCEYLKLNPFYLTDFVYFRATKINKNEEGRIKNQPHIKTVDHQIFF